MTAENDIRLAADGGGIRVDNGASLVSANGNITLEGTSTSPAAGVHLNGTTNSKVNISAANGTITLNGTSATGTGVLVSNALVDALRAAIRGSSTQGSYGFSLTDTTLGANLASLQNVSLSSAGSGAGAINFLDNSIVTDLSRNNLLMKQIENMTTVDMNGTAIFNSSLAAWNQQYSNASNPNGGWIFNNTTVNASSADLTGVSFTNSTLTMSNGNLNISNNGSLTLSQSNVTVNNGSVSLSGAAGDVDLSDTRLTTTGDIALSASGAANLNNATISTTGGAVSVAANGGALNMTDGNVSAADDIALSASGAANLNNATISTTGGAVSVAANGGALNMTGGNVSAADDIALSASGAANLNNATISTTGGAVSAVACLICLITSLLRCILFSAGYFGVTFVSIWL